MPTPAASSDFVLAAVSESSALGRKIIAELAERGFQVFSFKNNDELMRSTHIADAVAIVLDARNVDGEIKGYLNVLRMVNPSAHVALVCGTTANCHLPDVNFLQDPDGDIQRLGEAIRSWRQTGMRRANIYS